MLSGRLLYNNEAIAFNYYFDRFKYLAEASAFQERFGVEFIYVAI
jgi:hypothetical protein